MTRAYNALVAKHSGDRIAAKAALDALLEQRREEAEAMPIDGVADRLGITAGLKRSSHELVGPCPVCGGRDRFAINPNKGVFLCRHCNANGGHGHGGTVALVRHTLGCDYGSAVDWLLGEIDLGISPEEIARREEQARADRDKRERDAAHFRKMAIESARRTWAKAKPATNTPAHTYLIGRGIDHASVPVLPPTLRFIADHPYVKRVDRAPVRMHLGPAMIAAVQDMDGRVVAVHQTWIDPARPGEKARIIHDDEPQAAKLVRGAKKGGAIRLSSSKGCDTLVMGEGIETTLSAMVADVFDSAAYWAGVDLGNMAGRMERVTGKRWSARPDLDDAEAFIPPAWVKRLIFIQDGDSDAKATRAKLEAGLRRAMVHRPGLVGEIVHAGDGKDLNDVLREGAQ